MRHERGQRGPATPLTFSTLSVKTAEHACQAANPGIRAVVGAGRATRQQQVLVEPFFVDEMQRLASAKRDQRQAEHAAEQHRVSNAN